MHICIRWFYLYRYDLHRFPQSWLSLAYRYTRVQIRWGKPCIESKYICQPGAGFLYQHPVLFEEHPNQQNLSVVLFIQVWFASFSSIVIITYVSIYVGSNQMGKAAHWIKIPLSIESFFYICSSNKDKGCDNEKQIYTKHPGALCKT